jgi:hypothetical protein
MKPSPEQMQRIYLAWSYGRPPLTVAKELRLAPTTVIAEYVRLDGIK